MFRLIRWIFSTIFTLIVVGLILYYFKFEIKGDYLCITLRHKEHKQQIRVIEKKVEESIDKSKHEITRKIKKKVIKELQKDNLQRNREGNSDKEKLKKIIDQNL